MLADLLCISLCKPGAFARCIRNSRSFTGGVHLVLWSAVLGARASHWHVTQNVATNSALQPGAHPLAAGGQCQIRFSRGDSLAITARSLARSLVISSRPRRVRRNLNLHYARTQVRSSGRSLWHLVRLAVGVKVVLVRPLYIFYAESLREYTGRVRMTSPRRRLGTGTRPTPPTTTQWTTSGTRVTPTPTTAARSTRAWRTRPRSSRRRTQGPSGHFRAPPIVLSFK